MLIDDLVPSINLSQTEAKFWLCKPDLSKTPIARLWEIKNMAKLNLKLGNVNQLEIKIPYKIDVDHVLTDNPHINLIKDRYIIKLIWGNYVEYFTIRIPSDSMAEDSNLKTFTCYSLQYELNDKNIKSYSVISYNAREALVGNGVDKIGILNNTLWTVDYIDSDFLTTYRSIDIPSSTALNGIFQIATTFGAITLWDTSTRKVSLYKQENIGLDRGLKFSYGRYLKTLQQDINSDDICTRLAVYGKNNISIQAVNPTGTNYIEDYSYFLYPFERDINKTVITSSNYMSDSLCNSLLDYQALIKAKEPITKIAEAGTTTTNITITNHSLVVGDYILNTTKGNIVKQVLAVVDTNNITVDVIIGQTESDSINLYKDGTFGKLLYQLNDQELILTTKQNELTTLQTDMNMILDQLDIAQSTGASTAQISINLNNKQAQIDAKQAEINTVNSNITSINNQIATLRSTIAIESSLTGNQLLELNQFIVEKEVLNDYIDDTGRLLTWAKEEFNKIKTPPINLKVGIVDLFKAYDKCVQIDRDKLVLSEVVTVKYDLMNINIKAKIIEIDVDFENYDSLTVTIANVQQILTDKQKFTQRLNQAVSTSTQVDLEKFKWNKVVEDTTEISQLLNQTWSTAQRAINAGVNESVTVDRRGITIQDPSDPLKLIRATHGVIGFSADGGNTFNVALDASGVYASKLVGQIIAGVNLQITNTSGTFMVDANGVTLSGMALTVTGGLPSSQMDSTVVTNASNGNIAYSGTTKYRTSGAPTNVPIPTGLETILNSNGTINIKLSWNTYVQGIKQADMLLLFWKKGIAPLGIPTINDASVMFNVNTANPSYYIFEGVNPADNFSFGIAAARKTENGLEVGNIVSINGDSTFTRTSIAYKQDGSQVTSGAPRYETGKYGQAVTIEENTANLLTANQSNIETDTTGLSGWSSHSSHTISRDIANSWNGLASVKVVSNYAGSQDIYILCGNSSRIPVTSNTIYTFSIYIKTQTATSRTCTPHIWWYDSTGVSINSSVGIATNVGSGWIRLTITGLSPSTAASCYVDIGGIGFLQNEVIWGDGLQFEQKSYATSWQIGGTSRVAETLTIPTSGIFIKGNWTVELTYIPKINYTANKKGVLWSCYIDANNYYELRKDITTGYLTLTVVSGGVAKTITGTTALIVDSPYSIMASGDGTYLRLFMNDVQVGSNISYIEPLGILPTNMYIGSDSSSINQCNGLVDDLRISSMARLTSDTTSLLPIDGYTTCKLTFDGFLNGFDWQDITFGTPNFTGNINGFPASNVLQQGISYNNVVINSTDGIKVTYPNGDYSQMYGGGFFKHTVDGNKDYHFLNISGSASTITKDPNTNIPDPVTVTLPANFQNKNFSIALSVQSMPGIGGYFAGQTLQVTSINYINATFTVESHAQYDYTGTPPSNQFVGLTFSYVIIA